VLAEGTKTDKIQVITQRIAHAFEQPIREHSIDWHMMQPVWLADLDPNRGSRGVSEAGPGAHRESSRRRAE